MAEITIYKTGAEKSFNGDVPDLKKEKDFFGIGNSFNDRIDSIFVKSGVWRLFVDIDFNGASKDYMYGSHHDNVFLGNVSSIKLLREGGNWVALRTDLDWYLTPSNRAKGYEQMRDALRMNDENYMGAVKNAYHEHGDKNSVINFDACASENQGELYRLARSLLKE